MIDRARGRGRKRKLSTTHLVNPLQSHFSMIVWFSFVWFGLGLVCV